MAESLDARMAATMIESIKDEAAPTPFNPMEFEDDHRAVSTKRTAAAMAVNKSNNNNDSDVRKHYHSCPRRRYRAHVDEEEEDTLVNRHGQRTAVTLVLLVENNTLQEVDLISIKTQYRKRFWWRRETRRSSSMVETTANTTLTWHCMYSLGSIGN